MPKVSNQAPQAAADVNLTVGYYDLVLGAGNSSMVPAIEAASLTPVYLNDLSAQSLVGIDIIYLQNPSNDGYGGEFQSQLGSLFNAVSQGALMILNDRHVVSAELVLPNGQSLNIISNPSASIDVETTDPDFIAGPGGILDNGALDGAIRATTATLSAPACRSTRWCCSITATRTKLWPSSTVTA